MLLISHRGNLNGIQKKRENSPAYINEALSKGYVTEVAEKKVISKNATVGVYYWKHGSDYVSSAEEMIRKNIRINNEFYVCPTYNEFLSKGKKVKIHNVDKMWGLGTPEDLNNFLQNIR